MIKECAWCGEEFAAKGRQKYCTADHYSTCTVCGDSFVITDYTYIKKSCSKSCADVLTASRQNHPEKKCLFCGEMFAPRSKAQKYCASPHPMSCHVCGVDIERIIVEDKTYYACSERSCINEVSRLVNRERYGVDNSSQSTEARKKIRDKKNSRSEEDKRTEREKATQTNRERYGTDYATQSPEVREKTRETVLARYGADNVGTVDAFREKARETTHERYGVDCSFESDAVKEKIAATNMDRYGTLHPRQHDDTVRERAEQTNLQRYGTKNVFESDIVKQKIVENNLARYGVEYNGERSDVQEKIKSTFVDKYGHDNPLKAPEVREQVRQTNLERFGAENPMQSLEIQQKHHRSMLEKYGVKNLFELEDVQDRIKNTIMERYGVRPVLALPENQLKSALAGRKRISKTNNTWRKRLQQRTSVEFSFEVPFGENHYADLGYDDLLIDVNPTVSHNSTIPFSHAVGYCADDDDCACIAVKRTQHQRRAMDAEKDGKLLLQYFEWMDPAIFTAIVESKLRKTERRIPAKKTTLREIPQKTANTFFRENHLRGASTNQTLCLGLYHDDELVHVQTYGRARISRKAEWEAIRSCSKVGVQVQGGFSKCDKHFFKTIDPESVVSYVDLNISQGHTDSMFDGWRLESVNNPNTMWAKFTGSSVDQRLYINDNTARRVSADRLLGFDVGERYPRADKNGSTITNEHVLLNEGYVKVHDAGTKTFLWRKDDDT